MHNQTFEYLKHFHDFGQGHKRHAEFRTFLVITITGIMMVIEIAAGLISGSMALLADGLHMASHTAALSINALAYVYTRRHAHDPHYNFGTGKVNALGGFTGAILLAGFALIMVWESMERFLFPVQINFNQAIFVAILGLIVNGLSIFILGHNGHQHDHEINRPHTHKRGNSLDPNLRSAHLHVLADALTSLLAIFALLTAKYFGTLWIDPLMGILGAILVSRWSLGLLRTTSSLLLDKRGPEDIQAKT